MTYPGIASTIFALVLGLSSMPFGVEWAQGQEPAAAPKKAAATRKFQFVYAGTINQLTPGASARVWLPVAPNTFGQVSEIAQVETPGEFRTTQETRYGNSLIYCEATANERGEIPLSVRYTVERREQLQSATEPAEQTGLARYLSPPKETPSGGSFLRTLLLDENAAKSHAPIALAKQIYDAVDRTLRYDKPAGGRWGRGDAAWACQSGYGNCTDFHSLFMAACYEAEIPTRFEIGFSIPTERGGGAVMGYHCWAKFVADGGWVPVDISEADKHPELKDYYFGNLTADRVLFSVGRDLQLEPRQQAGPVNFMIYPYVEVEGKPHAAFAPAFRFEDLP